MNILIVDDEVSRYHNILKNASGNHTFMHVKSYQEFLYLPNKDEYTLFFLDHDLGASDALSTGKDVAQFMERNNLQFYNAASIVIHSTNPYGVHYMLEHLSATDYNVVVAPYKDDLFFIKDNELIIKYKIYG